MRLLRVFAALLVTGCGTSLAHLPVRLDVEPRSRDAELRRDDAIVEPDSGSVVVRGRFDMADPCNKLVATAIRSAGQIRVTVTAQRYETQFGRCPVNAQRFDYVATVAGVLRGDVEVIVRHEVTSESAPLARTLVVRQQTVHVR